MTSAANILTSISPSEAHATPLGLNPRGETAWIDKFANQAVSHMAASGVMSIKTALAYLLEEDCNHPEQDKRGT